MKNSSDTPRSIQFLRAGGTRVLGPLGQRMRNFEGETHADSISKLRAAGIRYEKLIVHGLPQSYPVRR